MLLEIILILIGIYLGIGVVFAAWFVIFGITRLDESAKGTSFGFRLIVFFGVTIFWALLAKRLLLKESLPMESNAHRRRSLEAK